MLGSCFAPGFSEEKVKLTSRAAFALGLTFASGLAVAEVDTFDRPSLDRLRKAIVSEHPQTKAARVDHDNLTVRRLSVVDDTGTVRMVLAGKAPEPIVDGIQYRRAFSPAGITFYDENGSEKGGAGIAPGGVAALAMDHANSDAIGWRVMPDGTVMFGLNQRPPQLREPALGNRLFPMPAPTRIKLAVAPDGTPEISLTDAKERPRLRLTVNAEGQGAIEFLDSNGRLVDSLVPENRRWPMKAASKGGSFEELLPRPSFEKSG